jgi:DNA-directed RNA polymerase specialized sigma24 family protein
MTAQEFLNQPIALERIINRKQKHIAALQNLLESDTPKLTGMPRSPSPNDSRMADIVAEIVDLEKEVEEDADRLKTVRREIVDVVYALESDLERDVVDAKYIQGMRWDDICHKMGFTKSYILSVHNRALQHIRVPQKESTKKVPEKT